MRRFLLLLCCFLAYQTLNAESVSKNDALKKAQRFMPGKHFVESKSMASTRGEASSDAFYVFNADNDGGYVIVSGDDRTTEILGYSKTGNLDMDHLPENLKWWLDGYVRQIEALGTSVKPAQTQKTKTRGSGNWKAIEPLIQTKWNQDAPYNLMCPDSKGRVWTDEGFATNNEGVYSVNNICVTGCVATAIAQMLYYYCKNPNLPSTYPALEGYETRSKEWSMKALPATTFDWDAMKLSYNGNETDASATAIATLMRYCGQSVNMDYTLGASEASVNPLVLINVFGFSKNIRQLYRDVYTTSQWEEIIYAELEAKRPVFYSGQADDGGHRFIVDGYDGNGLFHMNWGWGGFHDDEYFVLSLADPDGQGLGGSVTNGAFQFRQDALIGVEPGSSEEKIMPQIESYIDLMTQDYSRTDADDDFTDVQFQGTFHTHYNLPSTESLSVWVGWALCQNGVINKVFSLDEYYIAKGQTYPGNNADLEVTFGAGMALGKYEVSMVYKYREDAEWSLCSPYHYTNFFIAEVTETTLKIRQVQPSFTVNSITVPEYPGTDSPLDVTLNVTNDGETFEQVIWLWAQKEGETTWTRVATATRRIDPGESDDVVMSFIPSVAGDYTLKATKADSEEALKSATVTIYASFEKNINNVTYFCNVGTKKAKVIGNTLPSGSPVAVSIPTTIEDNGIQFTVTEIADGAFAYCFPMTSLIIPSTVESIGKSAVYNCYMLSEIKIPEGVHSIGSRAFQYCQWVETIELPASLTSIGDYAFGNLRYLTSVVSSVTNPFAIADNVFGVEDDDIMTAPTATLIVPIGSKESYDETAGWMKFPIIYQGEVKDYTENDITYTYITGEDFAIVKKGNKTALEGKDVVIPSTIQVDGKSYNIKKIAEWAFNQVAMKSLTIEPGVEEISDYAFYNAYMIEQIIIPKGVKSIGACAFQYCNGVETIKLPASLTSIGEYAFGNICKSVSWKPVVSVVSCITNPFAIADNVFGVEDGETLTAPVATLSVPAGSKESYMKAAGWKEFPTPVEMEPKPGDVNVDYEVDEKDLEAIAEYINAGQYEKKADLNNDNKVNAADIVEIVKIIKK